VSRDLVKIVIGVVVGAVLVAALPTRAEQPAIDRALVERLVRAVESQTRAIERCKGK
jgi:hypothetical protein